jgi:hypothetical protein
MTTLVIVHDASGKIHAAFRPVDSGPLTLRAEARDGQFVLEIDEPPTLAELPIVDVGQKHQVDVGAGRLVKMEPS